jgi:hypothetical protein
MRLSPFYCVIVSSASRDIVVNRADLSAICDTGGVGANIIISVDEML